MFPVAMASPVGAGFAPALCHQQPTLLDLSLSDFCREFRANGFSCVLRLRALPGFSWTDRKSTRLNSSHQIISYAVFCLKKKKRVAIESKTLSQLRTYCSIISARSSIT